jgi:hypothetical protein
VGFGRGIDRGRKVAGRVLMVINGNETKSRSWQTSSTEQTPRVALSFLPLAHFPPDPGLLTPTSLQPLTSRSFQSNPSNIAGAAPIRPSLSFHLVQVRSDASAFVTKMNNTMIPLSEQSEADLKFMDTAVLLVRPCSISPISDPALTLLPSGGRSSQCKRNPGRLRSRAQQCHRRSWS